MSISDVEARATTLASPKENGSLAADVTIIIPAYNEEHGIAAVVKRLRQAMDDSGVEYELLVVNDGSIDHTATAARATGVTVISHARNRGYGAALKTGIQHARYERIAIIDADGSYPPQEIPRLAAGLDTADMVVGARTGPHAAIPLIRRPAKWFLTWLASYLTGTRIPDLNSGLRLFRRSLALEFLDLLPSGFSFTTTITLASLNSGYTVRFEQVDYYARVGRSKIRPIHDTFNFLMLILRMTLIFRPLHVYLPLSAAIFVAAALILAIGWFGFGHVFGFTFIIMVQAAFQAAMIGLLADVVNVRRSRAP